MSWFQKDKKAPDKWEAGWLRILKVVNPNLPQDLTRVFYGDVLSSLAAYIEKLENRVKELEKK